MKRYIVLVSALVALGCGGSGGGSAVTNTAVAELMVSKTTINYGELVELRATKGEDVRVLANLYSNGGSVGGGLSTPFVDHPAIDTTYLLFADNEVTGDSLTYRKTVVVRKTTRRYLIVGDAAVQDVKDAATFVGQLSSVAPVLASTLPSDLSAYDAVVVFESSGVTPAAVPTLTGHLAAGHGVVLVGRAAQLLATGDENNNDLSALKAWTGLMQVGSFGGGFAHPVHFSYVGGVSYGPSFKHPVRVATPTPTGTGFYGNYVGGGLVFHEPVGGGRTLYLSEVGHSNDVTMQYIIPANGYGWDYVVKSHLQWVAH